MAPSRSTPQMMQVTRAAFRAHVSPNQQATDPKSHTLVKISLQDSFKSCYLLNSYGRPHLLRRVLVIPPKALGGFTASVGTIRLIDEAGEPKGDRANLSPLSCWTESSLVRDYPTLGDKAAKDVLPSARRSKRSSGLSPFALATSAFTPSTELTGVWLTCKMTSPG